MHTLSDKKLLMLKPKDILPSRLSVRKNTYDYELKPLADSIAVSGIIEPILIRKTENGKYEIISGNRRFKAAVMAGMRRIPCVLHRVDSHKAALFSVLENYNRKELSFFEEAEAFNTLIYEYSIPKALICTALGISSSTLSEKLKLLKIAPENRKLITDSGLSQEHATELLRVPISKQVETINKIVAEGLTVAQTVTLINEFLNPATAKPPHEKKLPAAEPIRKSAIGDVRLFSNSLFKLVTSLQNAGFDANSKKYETEKYIEYKIRIKKEPPQNETAQLKII